MGGWICNSAIFCRRASRALAAASESWWGIGPGTYRTDGGAAVSEGAGVGAGAGAGGGVGWTIGAGVVDRGAGAGSAAAFLGLRGAGAGFAAGAGSWACNSLSFFSKASRARIWASVSAAVRESGTVHKAAAQTTRKDFEICIGFYLTQMGSSSNRFIGGLSEEEGIVFCRLLVFVASTLRPCKPPSSREPARK